MALLGRLSDSFRVLLRFNVITKQCFQTVLTDFVTVHLCSNFNFTAEFVIHVLTSGLYLQ
jgi:hypothetical protein